MSSVTFVATIVMIYSGHDAFIDTIYNVSFPIDILLLLLPIIASFCSGCSGGTTYRFIYLQEQRFSHFRKKGLKSNSTIEVHMDLM